MSDNRYHQYGCPPLMSYGRFVTTYVDSSVINQYIRGINKINSANEFKSFLQNNGDSILNKEREQIISKNTCDLGNKCTDHLNNTGKSCRGKCAC